MLPGFRIEHPHLQIPVSLLIDDPAPHVNPYYYHAKLRLKLGEPRLPSGEPVVREIPLSFMRRFVETIERRGIKGKFSILPYPSNLGWIGRGLEGYPEAECREWVKLARERLSHFMDFCPEMITHLLTVDTETMKPLEEDEHAWSQHQDEETLTRYIAKALRLLADAGIDANGVTSPWMFGEKVEWAYARAIGNAQRKVHDRKLTWYFLRSDGVSPVVPPVIPTGKIAEGEAVVHLRPSCGDVYWQTQDVVQSGEAYVGGIADNLITRDGLSGRIPTLVANGGWVTLITHWQSIFSQGRATGLMALEETARRISETYGSHAAWRTCWEVASAFAAAAGLRWNAEQDGKRLAVSLRSPFECKGFTVSWPAEREPRRVRVRRESGGKAADLSPCASSVPPLPTNNYAWTGGRLAVCLDLRGPVKIEVE